MVVSAVGCAGCGGTHTGREKDGGVQPFSDECPNCGAAEFSTPPFDPEAG